MDSDTGFQTIRDSSPAPGECAKHFSDVHKMEMNPSTKMKTNSVVKKIPRRFIFVCLCFWGVLTCFALRLNMSVAIVAMVTTQQENVTESKECTNFRNVSVIEGKVGEFTWDAETQGLVLGGYYYGYFVSQLPGGMIAQRVGGKRVFGLGLLVMSIVTLLTPVIARLHVYGLVVLRAFLGLTGGLAYIGIHVVLAKWAPSSEKSRIGSTVFAGIQLGTVVSQAVSGVLAGSTFLGGWPSVFYVMGVFAAGLAVIWMIVISESPGEHPSISDEERDYIQKTAIPTSKKIKTPWSLVLTSMPFWAFFVANVCNMWGLFTLFSYLPRYMEQVLHFNTKENGALSALPYLACWIFMMLIAFFSDFLRKHLSTRVVRKLMTAIGMFTPGGLLVAASYTGCDVTANVVLLTLAVGSCGFFYSGYYVNHLDIAPRHAGVIFGVSNAFASVTGFVAPYVVGFILSENQTQAEWRTVFFTCAGIYVFGAAFFVVFADGEVQRWAVDVIEVEIQQTVYVYGLPDNPDDLEKPARSKSLENPNTAERPGTTGKSEEPESPEKPGTTENSENPETRNKLESQEPQEHLPVRLLYNRKLVQR